MTILPCNDNLRSYLFKFRHPNHSITLSLFLILHLLLCFDPLNFHSPICFCFLLLLYKLLLCSSFYILLLACYTHTLFHDLLLCPSIFTSGLSHFQSACAHRHCPSPLLQACKPNQSTEGGSSGQSLPPHVGALGQAEDQSCPTKRRRASSPSKVIMTLSLNSSHRCVFLTFCTSLTFISSTSFDQSDSWAGNAAPQPVPSWYLSPQKLQVCAVCLLFLFLVFLLYLHVSAF